MHPLKIMDTVRECRDIVLLVPTLCVMKSRMLSRGKEARQSPQVIVSGDLLAPGSLISGQQ